MTLDPVHFDGIDALAQRIRSDYDDSNQEQNTEELWNLLNPLLQDGEPVFYPINTQMRGRANPEDLALTEDKYTTQYGLDSGTLNPRAFNNGLVLDLAHAALASVPSQLHLHRKRTLITTVYSSDATALLDDDWLSFDNNNSRGRVVQVSSDLDKHEREAVHAYALYLSESSHLLNNLNEIDDLLYLDGPLYPKGVVRWIDEGEPIVKDSRNTREVIKNYTKAIDNFLERGIPVVGFVKNMSSRQVVRLLKQKALCPWSTDYSFFKAVLTTENDVTYTNWFVSKFHVERTVLSSDKEWITERSHDPEMYLPSQMMVYDPRSERVYKAEAPYGFVRDEEIRDKLTRQILKEVAVGGVPRAVRKADELARISREQKKGLLDSLERTLGSSVDVSYDEERWSYINSSIGLTE